MVIWHLLWPCLLCLVHLEYEAYFLLAGDVFTKDQLDGYMALKWEEVYAYEHTPHPIEFQMYYSC